MMRKFILIKLLLAGIVLFSGCYTVISTKKFSRKAWKKYHKNQYFEDTKWGSEWNDYYWSPRIDKKTERKVTTEKEEEEKIIHEGEIYQIDDDDRDHRYYHNNTCCMSNCIFPFDIFIPDDDSDDDSDDDTDTPETPEKPERKRGM